jgi:hypothetical protein
LICFSASNAFFDASRSAWNWQTWCGTSGHRSGSASNSCSCASRIVLHTFTSNAITGAQSRRRAPGTPSRCLAPAQRHPLTRWSSILLHLREPHSWSSSASLLARKSVQDASHRESMSLHAIFTPVAPVM